jgi:hypothetical protein
MLLVGFEPAIPVLERAKTVHALDRAVTVIGSPSISYDLSHQHLFQLIIRYRPVVRLYSIQTVLTSSFEINT